MSTSDSADSDESRALAHSCSSQAILLVLMECRWPIAAALAAAVIAAADIAAVDLLSPLQHRQG